MLEENSELEIFVNCHRGFYKNPSKVDKNNRESTFFSFEVILDEIVSRDEK